MQRTQQSERLVVALLDSSQQASAQRLDFLADLTRLADEELEPHERQRLIEPAHDRAHVESGGGCAHQKSWVDGRVIERWALKDALKVQAVMNLEEPIGDCIPVTQQLRILRYAEV